MAQVGQRPIDAGTIISRARSKAYRMQLSCRTCRLTFYANPKRNAAQDVICPGCGQRQSPNIMNAITKGRDA